MSGIVTLYGEAVDGDERSNEKVPEAAVADGIEVEGPALELAPRPSSLIDRGAVPGVSGAPALADANAFRS